MGAEMEPRGNTSHEQKNRETNNNTKRRQNVYRSLNVGLEVGILVRTRSTPKLTTIQTILKAHLPKPPPPVESDDCEDHTLVTLDPVESFRATDIPDENAGDDDDDERMGGGGGAECRQQ